ncbi:MAG: hypothetical protein JXA01_01735 [Dehalococcoidia bacterium]|nr:hypothetical protein [Dehalococcoidia bacterium]
MRVSNFKELNHFTVIYRIFLCLAVVVITVLGADKSAAASSATGIPPEIKAFTADPLTLGDGESALYKFVVAGATNMQVIEAGAVIKEIHSPPGTTMRGSARGMTTYEIRTGDMNTFEAVLIAGNGSGEVKKALMLSFETRLQPGSDSQVPPGSDNQTEGRTPKWGPQSSGPAPAPYPTSLSTASAWTPPFARCSSECNRCLRPGEAAEHGFTNRCSEQPCYYSPDNQQQWYCYSEPETIWCCRDGKVTETTKEQCMQTGGTYYAAEAEAVRACQQLVGWYCSEGMVYHGSKAQAMQVGATWYSTEAEAVRACQGWCCKDGKVGQTNRSQCSQLGGDWFSTQIQALQACQQAGWCCSGGKVYQSTNTQCTQLGGTWYTTQVQAAQYCQPVTYWCCSNGQVYQTPVYTSGCYRTQAEAVKACQQTTTCWCCGGGKVFQTTQASCTRVGGTCYSSQSQATAACRQTQLK